MSVLRRWWIESLRLMMARRRTEYRITSQRARRSKTESLERVEPKKM